eukprot:16449212-Heterocapsa_arctica.AAC.1
MESQADQEEWQSSLGTEQDCTFSRFMDLTGQKDQQGQNYYERGNKSIRDRFGTFITQLGRVPWVMGGDWNMGPGACVIEGMNNSA